MSGVPAAFRVVRFDATSLGIVLSSSSSTALLGDWKALSSIMRRGLNRVKPRWESASHVGHGALEPAATQFGVGELRPRDGASVDAGGGVHRGHELERPQRI